jgi:hypothetical protein
MNAAAERGDVFRLFLHNIKAAGVADIVGYRTGATGDILPQLEPASFDVIYVDGSHAFDDVLCDLSHAIRLIRDGGVICGDDLELQRDALDPGEHAVALASGRDYVRAESAGTHYHPGVTEAVARLAGPVFSWNGFWAGRRKSSKWEWLDIEPGPLPDHIVDALRASAPDGSTDSSEGNQSAPLAVELVAETTKFNLVRLGSRYVAALKALGPLALGSDRIGERDLEPVLLVGASLDDVRSRAEANEPRLVEAEHAELVGETASYNLVQQGSRYVAVLKKLGPLVLGSERIGERDLEPVVLVGASLDDVRSRAETHEPPPSDVELIEEAPEYNLVRFGSRYLAVSRTLGPISIGKELIGERELPPLILMSPTLEELRSRVAAAVKGLERDVAEERKT